MPRKIKVLIVDDSAFMRKALVRMLSSDPGITVIGTASDGEEGYKKALEQRPDVITLDVNMPGMDGLGALRLIMRDCPAPVIMLSSLTSEGGEITLKALDLGAVDIIDKSSAHTAMDITHIAGELVAKVRAVAGVDAHKIAKGIAAPEIPSPACAPEARVEHAGRFEVIAIGASTGGPPALQDILTKFPADFPVPVLVVQHMPQGFTASLAERLNNLSHLAISEAFDGDTLIPGRCLIAPSGLHMTLRKSGGTYSVSLSREPIDTLHRPSVDVLMESVAKAAGRKALGVLLTGMGADGARGMKAMHDAGARTLAQDEESCVVYGMPKVAVDMGGVDRSVPLPKMASAILDELVAPVLF